MNDKRKALQFESYQEFKDEYAEGLLITRKIEAITDNPKIQLAIVNEIVFGLCKGCWNAPLFCGCNDPPPKP